MVDKVTGQVAYAVMSFGGFLGLGQSYHPLPWRLLTYDTKVGGYVVDLDKERLQDAPSYTRREPCVGPGLRQEHRRVLREPVVDAGRPGVPAAPPPHGETGAGKPKGP